MDTLSLKYSDWEEIFVSHGEPKYRVGQVFSELHNGKKLSDITTLPKTLRQELAMEIEDTGLEIYKSIESHGTVKYLYKLSDNNIIEGVLMDYKHGKSLCVSTQVGCRMGCAFCASGLDGLIRNLTAGEILAQVIKVNESLGGNIKDRKITNLVLMGSGEPLDNYDNVTAFLRNVTDPHGINISQRNISLSSCGLAQNIRRLADDGFSVNLSLSLHASTDESRKSIMKVAQAYTIKEVLDACKYYFDKTGRRFIIEYTMIKGVNDSFQDADRLAKLLKGLTCHVNVINLNPVAERDLKPSPKHNVYAFVDKLTSLGISASVRRTLGDDIDGACGQLRRKVLKGNE